MVSTLHHSHLCVIFIHRFAKFLQQTRKFMWQISIEWSLGVLQSTKGLYCSGYTKKKKKKKGPSSCPSLMKLPCKLALYDYYLAMKSIFLMFLMVTRYSVQVLVNGGNGVYGGWVLVKGYHCYNSDISMRLNHLLSFSKTKTKTNKHKKRTNHELRGRTYMRVEEDICNWNPLSVSFLFICSLFWL